MRKLPSVAQDYVSNVAHAQAVNHHHTGGDTSYGHAFVLGKFQNRAVFHDENIFFRHPQFLRQFGVTNQVMIFAMDGYKKLGANQIVHEFQLFLTRVSGHMDAFALAVNHIRAQL